jgi:hypothetical protein
MPHNAVAAISQPFTLHRGQKRLRRRLNRLGQKTARAVLKIDVSGSSKSPALRKGRIVLSLVIGVSPLQEVQVGLHPPRYATLLTKPSHSFGHSSKWTQGAPNCQNWLTPYANVQIPIATSNAAAMRDTNAECTSTRREAVAIPAESDARNSTTV